MRLKYKRQEYFKWIMTAVLVLLVCAAMVFLIAGTRRWNQASITDDTQAGEEMQLEGTLANAYIVSCGKDHILVHYQGMDYTFSGTLETDYTGVADLEVAHGQIQCVYAKVSGIEGMLNRYTEEIVQVSGYGELSYEGELPVYVLQNESFVGEKKLSDLVIGASDVRLVVAEGKACALIQYRQENFENIRVLIKNKDDITYSKLYLTSDKAYTVGSTKIKAKKVTDIAKLLGDAKEGEEVLISSGQGMLYLCDKKGTYQTKGYEGDFLVTRKGDGYVLVNELPIETYLRYVLPSEMPTYFSYEALKAQAVCARTFAYKQMRQNAYAEYGANLDDSTAYQVYHASSTYEVTDQAVRDTEGIVITKDGALIDCYYYSTSPGYSENLEVWDARSPEYLQAENHTKEKTIDLSKKKAFHAFINREPDSYDVKSPYYRWSATISADLGMDAEYGRLEKITVNDRSASGYVLSLTVTFEHGERTYEKENEIRFALGKYVKSVTLSDGSTRSVPGSVPSACFEVISQKDGVIELKGGGFGHGIGMSQYGADAMGSEGKSWQEIIAFYYKDTELVSVQ